MNKDLVAQGSILTTYKPSLHYHGEDKGCGRIKMLPSSWKFPFGIDKLLKTLDAEKKRKLPEFCLEDHERHGDTYGQYAGGLFTIITRDSKNISSLLSEKFSKFGYGKLRSICFGILLGEGIFTEDGEEWKASRRLVASELHKPRYPALHVIDRGYQYATFVLCASLFLGNSTYTLRLEFKANNEGTRFSKAFNEAMVWLATRERFKMFAWLVTTPGLIRSCRTARDSLENMIIEAQRLEKQSDRASTFTDFLGKTTDLGKARDELMNVLFAARDSNSSLLCWLVYALAREPAVLKVQQEVLAVLGDNSDSPPTDEDLVKMQYLDNVICETLRLFPAVPINGRLCSEATTLPSGGGESGEDPILVPKGALVCFSTYVCQRLTRYYGSDAKKFRPERWEEVDAKTRTKDYTFHPFIGGPRKCLGERFALKLAKYTICRLVQSFRLMAPEACGFVGSNWQEQIQYQIGLTMSPEGGVFVRLQK